MRVSFGQLSPKSLRWRFEENMKIHIVSLLFNTWLLESTDVFSTVKPKVSDVSLSQEFISFSWFPVRGTHRSCASCLGSAEVFFNLSRTIIRKPPSRERTIPSSCQLHSRYNVLGTPPCSDTVLILILFYLFSFKTSESCSAAH